jgi:hypothetical protein
MPKINPPFNFYSKALSVDTRLRCTQSQVYLEEKKPFFLVRFFRWITGQYNEDRIINALNRIARNFIAKEHTTEECNLLLKNYNILILRQNAKSGTKLDPHNALIDNIRKQAEEAGILPKQNQPLEEVALDPALLKDCWAKAVDGDEDWEQDSLAECIDLPFSEKLATPETILNWVINPRNQKLAGLPVISLPKDSKSTDLIKELLDDLRISTPLDCIQLGLEPTQESLTQFLEKHRDTNLKKFFERGYLANLD